MRMWMLNPKTLCRKHLLGEHGELHKFRHNFVKQHAMYGYRGLIIPLKMQERHDELAAEMLERGYNHKSPYILPDVSYLKSENWTICPMQSRMELHRRCDDCWQQWRDYHGRFIKLKKEYGVI